MEPALAEKSGYRIWRHSGLNEPCGERMTAIVQAKVRHVRFSGQQFDLLLHPSGHSEDRAITDAFTELFGCLLAQEGERIKHPVADRDNSFAHRL